MYQKRVSLQVIISPCKEHDLFQARPERLYERKTTPSRVTVEKLYANIATLFNRNHYRQELIFNMDESWVAHQDKMPLNKVLFPLGDKPHKKCAGL